MYSGTGRGMEEFISCIGSARHATPPNSLLTPTVCAGLYVKVSPSSAAQRIIINGSCN